MGIDFAIEELYQTGWSALDTSGCEPDDTGRWIPTVQRVIAEFAADGLSLELKHVQLFDCFRAEWSDASGSPRGGVVGQSEIEAAVYALAQLRKTAARQA